MTKKHWWKYLLGVGALAIVGGVIAGGVVSCSNGNTTTTQTQPTKSASTTTSSTKSDTKTTHQTVNTPTTTNDYTLTPTAQQGVIYNENLETTNSSTRTTDAVLTSVPSSSTPNYLQTSSLAQRQGLDVYVGGELAAVINPTETPNPTLTLNLANPNLTAEQLSKAGNLLAVQPTLTNYQITYTGVMGDNGKASNQPAPANTPIQLAVMSDTQENDGVLEWGSGNSPLGAWFGIYCPHNQFNDGNYIYSVADFPVLPNGELNFTTVNAGFKFSYVDNGKTVNETLNINVDLSPFYLGTGNPFTYPTVDHLVVKNKATYLAYRKAHDYSKPLILQANAPTLPDSKIDQQCIIWNGAYYPIPAGLPGTVDIPFTPTVKDGKITGWTTPGIYAYFVNSTKNGVWEAVYQPDLFNINTFIGQK